MRVMSFVFKAVSLLALVGTVEARSATFYVNSGAKNGGNGSSWAKAFNNLDAALSAAKLTSGSDQIWVSKGTYKPAIIYQGSYSGTEANLKTFNLPSDVAIYGGFSGTEKSLNDRNKDLNPTILSGDLGGNDVDNPNVVDNPNSVRLDKSDNAWHVLTAEGVSGVILDSLIVRGGYAAGPDAGTLGNKFTIVTLQYLHASGGGLLARNGSKVTLNNMAFEYNASHSINANVRGPNFPPGQPALASGGGAIRSADSGTIVTIKSSYFDNNNSFGLGGNGGALSAILEGSFDISFSSFTNSTANRAGGAIHGKDANAISINTSVLKNNKVIGAVLGDESGGGIGLINTNLSVSNSLFENNASGPIAGGGGIIFQVAFDDGEAYSLNVDHSVFKNNLSAAFGGGAILIIGTKANPGSEAQISRSTFLGNEGGIGGAVYVDSIDTDLTESVFYNNKAWVNGGAVFASNFGDAIFGVTNRADRTPLNVSKSSFIGNTIVGIPEDRVTPVFLTDRFAFFQSRFFNDLPLAGVTSLAPGGGAIAVELNGNANITNSFFYGNSAPNAYGGALLVGGSYFERDTSPGMNQAYGELKNSYCAANSATLGGNNTYLLDPAGLGAFDNGVALITDGSCP